MNKILYILSQFDICAFIVFGLMAIILVYLLPHVFYVGSALFYPEKINAQHPLRVESIALSVVFPLACTAEAMLGFLLFGL